MHECSFKFDAQFLARPVGVICSTCGPIGACTDEEEAERVKLAHELFRGGIGKNLGVDKKPFL
jgi:hypothetical protein